jgi:hypothetical protein
VFHRQVCGAVLRIRAVCVPELDENGAAGTAEPDEDEPFH